MTPATTKSADAFALLQTFLLRWFLPEAALDAPPEVRERVASLAVAGREHILAARSAIDQRLPSSAASLYGSAIGRFFDARALVAPVEPAADGKTTLDPAAVVRESATAKTTAEQKDDAVLLLKEPLEASKWRARRRRRALALLDKVGTRLGAGLYPASDAEVTWLRVRRWAVTALVAASLSAAGNWWIRSPHNVARGKPVTASSVRMGAPQALVNGAIEWGTFGFHSDMTSGREWAMIDLLKFYSLTSAEIYARGEGRLDFNLPLSVELSDDGKTFRPAGACKELFTQATPCVVDLHRQRARYVRVSAPEVVLSEIEVYGKP
jgi:hypothetical protein